MLLRCKVPGGMTLQQHDAYMSNEDYTSPSLEHRFLCESSVRALVGINTEFCLLFIIW